MKLEQCHNFARGYARNRSTKQKERHVTTAGLFPYLLVLGVLRSTIVDNSINRARIALRVIPRTRVHPFAASRPLFPFLGWARPAPNASDPPKQN